MSSPSQNFPSVPPPPDAPIPPDAADWKQDVNDRLAAHRTRRGRVAGAQTSLPLDVQDVLPGLPREQLEQPVQPVRSRARVAARVAERYAKAPTYSEVLAQQEVVRALIEKPAKAASESQAMLTGLLGTGVLAESEKSMPVESKPPVQTGHSATVAAPDIALRVTEASERVDAGAYEIEDSAEEWIPGNLIEFPRVLVAARKARPRLAEGPLREDATVDTDPERSQLRIFEVEQETISTTAKVETVATEWSSIRLGALPREVQNELQHRQRSETAARTADAPVIDTALQTAPVTDRLMAGLVDGALVALAFLGFVAVFVACTTHPPSGKPAVIASACTLAAFFLLYQYLFFSFSECTPGMRYARIALCTFDDENPTRRQMQRRIGALVLSACPVALGFAWVWFDQDRLGWHDRISRTYQRSYR